MADYLTEVESIQKDPKLEQEVVLDSLFSAESHSDSYSGQKYLTLSELAQSIGDPARQLDPSIIFLAASGALLKIHEGEEGKDYRQGIKNALSGALPNLRVHKQQVAEAVLKIQRLRENGIKELTEDRNHGRTMIDVYPLRKAAT